MQAYFILQKKLEKYIQMNKELLDVKEDMSNLSVDYKFSKCRIKQTLNGFIQEKIKSTFQTYIIPVQKLYLCEDICYNKQFSLSYRILISILTFSVVVVHGECKCQKSFIDLGDSYYNSCEMCYFQFSDSLYFLKCEQKINCIKRSSNNFIDWQLFGYTDNSQYCQYEPYTNYDSTQCQRLCCQHFNTATRFNKGQQRQQIYTIQYCQDRKAVKSKLVVLLVSLLTSPLSILLFCLIACKCWKRTQNNNTLAENFGKPQESFINQNNFQLSSYNLHTHGPQKSDETETCAVCLDDQCNSYTNCGHYYHPQCLRQWLVKRPRCPVCVSKQYNPIKIYCINCKQGAKMEVFQRTPLNQEQLHKFQSLQKLTCQNCQKNPQDCFDQLQILSSHSRQLHQNNTRKKEFDKFLMQEENIWSIQRSFQVQKSHFMFEQQQQNQTERRLSSTLNNMEQDQTKNKKHYYFDRSIKSYIRSFKKDSQNPPIAEENLNKNNSPNKNLQKSQKVQENQTPQKLLFQQKHSNEFEHEQSEVPPQIKKSFHSMQLGQLQQKQEK